MAAGAGSARLIPSHGAELGITAEQTGMRAGAACHRQCLEGARRAKQCQISMGKSRALPWAAALLRAVFVSSLQKNGLCIRMGVVQQLCSGFPSVFLSRVLGTQYAANRLAESPGELTGRFPLTSIWLGSDPEVGAGLRHPLAPWMAWVMAITSGIQSPACRCLFCSKPSWLLGSCEYRVPCRKLKAMQWLCCRWPSCLPC